MYIYYWIYIQLYTYSARFSENMFPHIRHVSPPPKKRWADQDEQQLSFRVHIQQVPLLTLRCPCHRVWHPSIRWKNWYFHSGECQISSISRLSQLTVGMGRMVDGDFLLATFFFCFGGGGRTWLLDTLKTLRKVREEIPPKDDMPKID